MQSMIEAKAWLERLSKPRITSQELYEFRDWRDDPQNDAAYSTVEKEWERSSGRFVMVASSSGYDVIDRLTAMPAQFANAEMRDITEEDADAVLAVLNRRAYKRPTQA